MIDFYYNLGPNPMKVALFLEESTLAYNLIPVDTFRGEQFSPEITRLNPNNKLPIIVDDGVTIFDSNAILLYLAEKHDCFLPPVSHRAELLSWLMFVASGVGPYCGQSVHFHHYAPKPNDYAEKRYDFEARRHYGILNNHLENNAWMIGSTYSIVDMAVWGWVRNINLILGEEARADFPDVVRFVDMVEARAAAKTATSFPARYGLNTSFDDEARRNMFRHIGAQE